MQPGVYARDIGFVMAQGFDKGGFFGTSIDYRNLELAGELEQFSVDQRVALTNSPTEMRAISIFIPPSESVLAYCQERAQKPFEPVYSDSDAEYEAELELDLNAIEPQVALMGGPQNAAPLSDVVGTNIDHAFIGSCGSGMWEDLEIAATILEGNKIADNVRLFVVPGSQDSTKRLHENRPHGRVSRCRRLRDAGGLRYLFRRENGTDASGRSFYFDGSGKCPWPIWQQGRGTVLRITRDRGDIGNCWHDRRPT